MERVGILPGGTLLVPHIGPQVIIEKWLTEGSSAHLYIGHIPGADVDQKVIVKVAKPDLNPVIEEEWNTLDKLREFYVTSGRERSVTPWPHAYGDINGQTFIVMEFLSAEPVLLQLEAGTRFTESQVASFAVDLFDLLRYLHNNLKRIYPDFRIDNVRPEQDGVGGVRMRILDVGGMQGIDNADDPRCRNDVIAAGSYLFSLAAGYMISLVGGEVTEDIEETFKREPFLSNISWGTTQLFRRLLCRVPEYRITSASEAASVAADLSAWWSIDATDCLTLATDNSNKAEEAGKIDDKNRYAALARMQMDIFVRRGGRKVKGSETLLNQIVRAYEGSSYLEQGRHDLQFGEYSAATQNFEKGEALEANPALFRRWRYLSQAMQQQKDPALLATAEEITYLFEENKFSQVIERLGGLPQSMGRDQLEREAQIYSHYQTGHSFFDDQDYVAAKGEFELVQQLSAQISEPKDQKAILHSLGDPKELINRCTRFLQQAHGEGQFINELNKLKAEVSNGNSPHQEARQFAVRYRFSPQIQTAVIELIKLALVKLPLEECYFIGQTFYWFLSERSDELQRAYVLCRDLRDADLALREDRAESGASLLVNIAARTSEAQFQGIASIVHSMLQGWVTEHVNADAQIDDLLLWRKMEELTAKLPANTNSPEGRASSISEQISKQRMKIEQKLRRDIKNFISQIEILLYTPQPGKFSNERIWEFIRSFSMPDAELMFKNAIGRFKILEDYLRQAEEIISNLGLLGFTAEEANKLRQEFSKVRERYASQLKAFKSSQTSLSNLETMEALQQHWDALAQADIHASEPDREKIFKLLDDCLNYVWNEGLAEEQVLDIIAGCCNKIAKADGGMRGWGWLQQHQNMRYQFQLKELDNAKELYKNGSLDKAWEGFSTISPVVRTINEGVDLGVHILRTMELRQWAQENADRLKLGLPEYGIIASIEAYITEKIPARYFIDYGIVDYLQRRQRNDLLAKLGIVTRPTQKRASWNRVWGWGLGAIILFILVVVFILAKTYWLAPTTTSLPTATMTAPPTAIPPTQTLLPTSTPEVTAFPPTLLPTSIYLLSDPDPSHLANPDGKGALNQNYPALPIKSENTLKLDNAFKPCVDDPTRYCANMDKPLTAGQYALFIYDQPQAISSAKPNMNVQVSLVIAGDPKLKVPATMTLGPGQFQYGTYAEVNTFSEFQNFWIWVGNYQLDPTGIAEINAGYANGNTQQVTPAQLAILLKTVLLVKLNPDQWKGLPQPEGYSLQTILDVSNLYRGADAAKCEPSQDEKINALAWNGKYCSLPQGTGRFIGAGVLQPGSYEVYYHFIGQKTSGTLNWFTFAKIGDITSAGENAWKDIGPLGIGSPSQPVISADASGGIPLPIDAILIYYKIPKP